MSITVKHPETHNIHALKKIWKICFGDSDEYINTFFEKGFKPEYSLIALYDLKPVGMMYILPAMLNFKGKEYMGEYVYAVGVNPDYRNKGIMSAMEKKAVELAKKQGLSFLTLIPEREELFKMYEKLGYKTAFYNYIRSYMPFKTDRVDNVSIRPCDKIDFVQLRDKHLNSMSVYIDFLPPYDDYRFIEIQNIGSNVMLAVVDMQKFYFVGFKRGSIYLIKETSLPEAKLKRVLPLIANEFKVDVVSVKGKKGVVDSISAYAMYKCFDGEIDATVVKSNGAYINLMLD